MFRQMKNIDTAFRQMRLVSIVVILGSLGLSAYALYASHKAVSLAQSRIYILAYGKALEAFAADRKENIPVEARDHVRMFHHHFFTLDPDEKAISDNLTRALYLADLSAKQQYDNLKEKGFYANLIAGNISQEVEVDSVALHMNAYPFYFRCFARQRIIRTTSVVTRNLVTEGYLRHVARSDHNAHGFLIEKWKVLQNQDLQVQKR
jgi:conjugative transposon TraK protein